MLDEEREKRIRQLKEKETMLMERREKLKKKMAEKICRQQKIKIEEDIKYRERI